MTVEDITNRLNQYFSWLSSRQLEEWWPVLLAIAGLVIFLIVLVLRSRRKVMPGDALLRDIIDIKLADHNKTSGRNNHAEKGHSAHNPDKRRRKRKRINTTKGFKLAIRELNQRRHELIKSRQDELSLRHQAPAMVTVNEQIQNEAQAEAEVTESRQAGELSEQKVAEIAAVIEQFQQEIAEYSQAGQPRQQVSEFVGFDEQLQPEVIYGGRDERRPVQKVYEILPVDEPLHFRVTGSSRAVQHSEQKVAEITAVNEQIPNEVVAGSPTGQHPIQKLSEIEAVNELLQPEKPKPGQSEKIPEESPEQDLKSKKQPRPFDIAEFSKAAISRRQRQRSGIFNEDMDMDED